MKRLYFILCVTMVGILLGFSGCGSKSYLQTKDESSESYQESSPGEKAKSVTESCYVQVSGAVNKPGVYQLNAGSRVYQAIEKAGGLREDACATELNQARVLTDGEMIYISTIEESQKQTSTESDDGKVDINTATVAELTELPGIGETRAQTIVEYRESNGLFSCPEDIKNVSGIGDSLYGRMAEKIKVD